jgi:hypothetical protein
VHFGLDVVEGMIVVLKVVSIFFSMIPIFWLFFDQHFSLWICQSKMMDLMFWGDMKFDSSQVLVLNSVFVMIFIPLMNLFYGVFDRAGLKIMSFRCIMVGMVFVVGFFVVVVLVQ